MTETTNKVGQLSIECGQTVSRKSEQQQSIHLALDYDGISRRRCVGDDSRDVCDSILDGAADLTIKSC